jgi:Na+-transporting NADH:ubiquinone oxidoreductase subunit B
MRGLRNLLDRLGERLEGRPLLRPLQTLYDAVDTILFTPGHVTSTAPHVRDGLDLKRIMTIVIVALVPCILMALYNTGYQAQLAIAQGATPLDDWRTTLFTGLGFRFEPGRPISSIVHGSLYFVPVFAVAVVTAGAVEWVFAAVRKHEISEGFLVTSTLIPLILPATIPLWQVSLGTAFGIVFGKEIFGGTGMNFLNPALVSRAFLFFSYPAEISGDAPWIAADFLEVDTFSGATLLADAAGSQGALAAADWSRAFFGLIPGSMGETSALACLIGAAVLLGTGVGSWRTMAGVTLGTLAMSVLMNPLGPTTNPMLSVPFHWHIVLGGWALGTVFMATDPVSSAFSDIGKWLYGLGIGLLCVLIRVVNPAYPEGMMFAILFMNMMAPLIDHFVVERHIRRRAQRLV